jgi:hypothetical protein
VFVSQCCLGWWQIVAGHLVVWVEFQRLTEGLYAPTRSPGLPGARRSEWIPGRLPQGISSLRSFDLSSSLNWPASAVAMWFRKLCPEFAEPLAPPPHQGVRQNISPVKHANRPKPDGWRSKTLGRGSLGPLIRSRRNRYIDKKQVDMVAVILRYAVTDSTHQGPSNNGERQDPGCELVGRSCPDLFLPLPSATLSLHVRFVRRDACVTA